MQLQEAHRHWQLNGQESQGLQTRLSRCFFLTRDQDRWKFQLSTIVRISCSSVSLRKNSLVEHNGYMPRQWVFGLIPHVNTTLRVLNIVDAALEMQVAIQNLIVREMGQVENNDREFQTMSDELTDAKEQLRMASPAERDDPAPNMVYPDNRSPPQKQQVPLQSSSQPLKQQSRKDPRPQLVHPEPRPQMKHDAPRQEPVHERQESRPNQEPQQPPRQKQRVRIQEDSPTVDYGWGKRLRVVETGSQKMETDQVPESELPPVLEDDGLNATVIEVMTDVEVLLDGSSVIDVFAVNSARRKRVEVSEESDRE